MASIINFRTGPGRGAEEVATVLMAQVGRLKHRWRCCHEAPLQVTRSQNYQVRSLGASYPELGLTMILSSLFLLLIVVNATAIGPAIANAGNDVPLGCKSCCHTFKPLF